MGKNLLPHTTTRDRSRERPMINQILLNIYKMRDKVPYGTCLEKYLVNYR